ncbi:hypothetical protein BDN70DRAFT_879832 [Pholiota conissans]|uniref:F-box domain-containing protein n=1 Tax=Pholiota conissans TaxID=109636 RepID=A0A9P5YZT0_9AGAR|nr:hypothetical protein BDN70DRAFT_879832 [Pholiota conissans]
MAKINNVATMPYFCQHCDSLDDVLYFCKSKDASPCTSCQQLLEIQRKISETRIMLTKTRVLLNHLKDERPKIKEQANYCHDPFIHRLPMEIASTIFKFCISDGVIDLGLKGRRLGTQTNHIPLILSGVCRRWRSIAYSDPQLWKNVRITLYPAYNIAVQPTSTLVKEWLDRTGDLPLSIDFHAAEDWEYGEEWRTTKEIDISQIKEIIYTLKDESHRWLNFNFEGPLSMLSCFFHGERDILQLRTLQLTVPYKLRSHINTNDIELHQQKLSSLSTDGIPLSALSKFDWNLTNLAMKDASLVDYLEALRIAPRLIHCTFQDTRGDFDFNVPQNPVVHTRLQTLKVIHNSSIFHRKFLNHLSCPALTVLEMRHNTAKREFVMSSIIAFLQKSGCSLIKLSAWRVGLSVADITNICQMPTLRSLHLGFFQIDESNSESIPRVLFNRLAEYSIIQNEKEPRYLPFLIALTLNGVFGTEDWATLPAVFGTSTSSSHQIERHRHALKSIAISAAEKAVQNADNSELYIDEVTLQKILWLRDSSGVTWRIQRFWKGTSEDMILSAVKWYHGAKQVP